MGSPAYQRQIDRKGVRMTKEDILAIPAGRDLDALVARCVFGLEVEWATAWNGAPEPYCPDLRGPGDVNGWIASYSTDIAAAWEIVAARRAKGWWWSLTSYGGEGGGWRFSLGHEVWTEHKSDPDGTRIVLMDGGISAPLAICRAALISALAASTPTAVAEAASSSLSPPQSPQAAP